MTDVALDLAAEQAVLAVLVLYPSRWDEVASAVTAADFAGGHHGLLFQAMDELIEADGRFDVTSLASAPGVPEGLVHELITDTSPAVGLLGRHVARVARAAVARRLIHRLSDAQAALLDVDTDPADVLADLVEAAEAERFVGAMPPGYMPFADWALHGLQEPRPWVIPGVLRRASRLVLVAPEGIGKSTLGRQLAVCAAAGLHPFRLQAIEAQRVLVVDAENDPATAVSEDGTLDHASAHGVMATATRQVPGWDQSRLAVWSRPEGIDLRTRRDAGWLEAVIADHRPDLVLAGPLYKMFRRARGEDDETLGGAIQRILDRVRVRHDVALWLEHHSPKGQNGVRPLDPFGTSLWMRWPDIGVNLTPDDDGALKVGRFRGDRYRVTGLPDQLQRGRVWPWVGRWNSNGAVHGP